MALVGDIYTEQHGGGSPLLLFSGLSGVASAWSQLLPALVPHFQVVLHDHRGTGRSAASVIDYSIEQMASDVLTVMDGLGIERADFIGHSTGGAILQYLALSAPSRVGKAVLSATWCAPDPYFVHGFAFRKQLLMRMGPEAYSRMSSLTTYPPDWYTANHAKIEQMEKEAVARFPATEIQVSRIDAICRFDVRERLGDISAPTMVICARDDSLTPIALSRDVAERIPNARSHELAWGGHAAPSIASDDFAPAVLEFLRSSAA